MNLFRYPTTWVFVVDETTCFDSLRKIIPSEQIVLFFTDPSEAEREVKLRWQSALANSGSAGFEIDSLSRLIKTSSRFNQVSVVAADLGKCGRAAIELFERLSDCGVQRILLGKVSDEELAVREFNRGKIDRFVRRTETGACEKLLAFSRELENDWFSARGQMLDIDPDAISRLSTISFGLYFKNLIDRFEIVEHYYSASPRGVWCIDALGDHKFVVLASKGTLDYCLSSLENLQCPPDLLRDVKRREAITLLFDRVEGVGVDYDWLYNTVRIEELIPDSLWVGLHSEPPIDIDYDPKVHAFRANWSGE